MLCNSIEHQQQVIEEKRSKEEANVTLINQEIERLNQYIASKDLIREPKILKIEEFKQSGNLNNHVKADK